MVITANGQRKLEIKDFVKTIDMNAQLMARQSEQHDGPGIVPAVGAPALVLKRIRFLCKTCVRFGQTRKGFIAKPCTPLFATQLAYKRTALLTEL